MNKLVLSLAIASSLGLSACDSESIKDVEKEVIDNGTAVTASARVKFDPSAGAAGLSIPNDLIFQGTVDGTLEIQLMIQTMAQTLLLLLVLLTVGLFHNHSRLPLNFLGGLH